MRVSRPLTLIATLAFSLAALIHVEGQPRYSGGGGSGGGSVTWPTSGDVVISTGTNSPSGIAPVNGDVLFGVGGAWVASTLSIVNVTGGLCTTTTNSVQYDNAGAAGCAPMLDNSGVMDFTPSGGPVYQIAGTTFLSIPYTNDILLGLGAGGAISNSNGPMLCIGDNACGNVTTTSSDYVAVGNQSCGDGSSASGGGANVCVGYQAGKVMSGAYGDDTYIGHLAGSQTNANNNTCVGAFACEGASSSTNNANSVLGFQGGDSLTSGQLNVLLGNGSGTSLTTASNDICIGSKSCAGSTAITTGSRDIYISTGPAGIQCLPSSATVNDEFDLCGNGTGAGNTSPIMRCNIATIPAGWCQFNVPEADAAYTVSTLPATPPTGSRAYVTDAVSCSYTLAGGGSTYCQVSYNGSAWHGPQSLSIVGWAVVQAVALTNSVTIIASSNIASITYTSTGVYSVTLSGVTLTHGGAQETGAGSSGGGNSTWGAASTDITGTNPTFALWTNNPGGSGGQLGNMDGFCTITIVGQ